MDKSRLAPVVAAVCLAALSGCASIVNDQAGFNFQVNPSTARCRIDNWPINPKNGRMDGFVEIDTTRGHAVYCSAPGYEPAVVLVEAYVTPWIWGDIILGGPLGFMIDFMDGAAYRLTPDRLKISMEPTEAPR